MRDGQGNKLSSEEADKVKAAVTSKDDASLNVVSVDPKTGDKRDDSSQTQKQPAREQAPG